MATTKATKAAKVKIGDVIVTYDGYQRVTDKAQSRGLIVLTGVSLDSRDPTQRRHTYIEVALVRVVLLYYVALLEKHIAAKAAMKEAKATWESEMAALHDAEDAGELRGQVDRIAAANAAWMAARDAERIARKATFQDW